MSVNIAMVRAERVEEVEGLSSAALEECRLPLGFPIPVDTETQAIVEPIFEFMWARHCRTGKYVENTAKADVDDLRDWFQFLDHFEVPWDRVVREDIERYQSLMFKLISPKTHEPYKDKTINRRVGKVVDFYRFHNGRGTTEVDVGDRITAGRRPIDEDALAHTRGGYHRRVNDIVESGAGSEDDEVRAMSARQYQLIAEELGPVPELDASVDAQDRRPVRDRLWAEMCLHTGMRPGEPEKVTAYSILDLTPSDPNNPYGLTYLRIIGKGNKPRKVELPNRVLSWLIWYIENEREQAIQEGLRRGVIAKAPMALFVNHVSAKKNAGRRATYKTFNDAYASALKRAADKAGKTSGLLKSVVKVDPETKLEYVLMEPAFSPHCLRHTYSVWTYLAEKAQGNAEPWKNLQARLGHAQLATTVNTYLRVANEFEAQISDRITGHLAELLRSTQ